jgi:hypothetical protein
MLYKLLIYSKRPYTTKGTNYLDIHVLVTEQIINWCFSYQKYILNTTKSKIEKICHIKGRTCLSKIKLLNQIAGHIYWNSTYYVVVYSVFRFSNIKVFFLKFSGIPLGKEDFVLYSGHIQEVLR